MLLVFSVIAIAIGVACATASERHPVQRRRLQRLAGGLLVSGFALLGFWFPYV